MWRVLSGARVAIGGPVGLVGAYLLGNKFFKDYAGRK